MADRIFELETVLSDNLGRYLTISYEDCLNSILVISIEDSKTQSRETIALYDKEVKLLIGCLTYMSKALPSNKETNDG